MIIDEAGQALEAETLIAFQTKPKKCLLVGDTKQHPATVNSKLSETLNFNRSLLSRVIEDCQQHYSLLNEQYRMHPEISIWPSQKYYDNQLKNAPNTLEASYALEALREAEPFLGPYAFIDVPGKEEQGKSHSLFNTAESDAIVNVVTYLAKKYQIDVVKQVGVITFYKAQAENLSEKLKPHYPNINVQTVDGFQGGENDIIIISFVRENLDEKIGFLSDFRRLNVALTRARHALLMFGHRQTLENSKQDVAELIQNAVERNKVFPYQTMSLLFPENTEAKKQLPKKQKGSRYYKNPLTMEQKTTGQKYRFNKKYSDLQPTSRSDSLNWRNENWRNANKKIPQPKHHSNFPSKSDELNWRNKNWRNKVNEPLPLELPVEISPKTPEKQQDQVQGQEQHMFKRPI